MINQAATEEAAPTKKAIMVLLYLYKNEALCIAASSARAIFSAFSFIASSYAFVRFGPSKSSIERGSGFFMTEMAPTFSYASMASTRLPLRVKNTNGDLLIPPLITCSARSRPPLKLCPSRPRTSLIARSALRNSSHFFPRSSSSASVLFPSIGKYISKTNRSGFPGVLLCRSSKAVLSEVPTPM